MSGGKLGFHVTILGEDKAHTRFAEWLLKRCGARPDEYYVISPPAGEGSGKAFVAMQYPIQLSELRRRARIRAAALLVLTDADEQSTLERLRTLDQKMVDAELSKISTSDKLGCLVPKWSIETWFLVLRDDKAGTLETAGWTEAEKLKNQGRDLPAKNAAEIFLEFVQNRRAVEPLRAMFPSLVDGIEEFRRLQAKFAVLGRT